MDTRLGLLADNFNALPRESVVGDGAVRNSPAFNAVADRRSLCVMSGGGITNLDYCIAAPPATSVDSVRSRRYASDAIQSHTVSRNCVSFM